MALAQKSKTMIIMAVMIGLASVIIWPQQFAWVNNAPLSGATVLSDTINLGIKSFVASFKPALRFIARGIDAGVRGLQVTLHTIPWLMIVALVGLLGWRFKSMTLAIFCALSVLYMAISGHWFRSMNTLAMVGLSVPLALILGFGLGVWGAKSKSVYKVLMPTLDFMQTIPTFAYLAPLVVLFGFGPVPGVLASMIYAAPPITRNVILGLKQVPHDLYEVANISGASSWQRFIEIELPHAKHQMLVGVNQTVLASLSMVIIAAVIGGFDDIGREVLVATNKGSARFGQALGAGIVIVLLAVVIDRLTRAASESRATSVHLPLYFDAGVLIAAGVTGFIFTDQMDGLTAATATTIRSIEASINQGLTNFIGDYGLLLDQIKNNALVYILLPMRIGLAKAVLPFTWGVSFPPMMQNIYLLAVVGLSLFMAIKGRFTLGFLILGFGLVMFQGFTFLPWWMVVGSISYIAWRCVDLKFATITIAMLVLITWAGHWQDALYSVYLCTASVLVCLALGCPLGVWAAKSDRVSRVLAPINDTLQSIPLYIFLIPAVALFQINEFSALVAIVLYAIVPLIRYTEHGLRHVPETLLDAATAQGCSRWQKLIHIELPVARPTILLGLNQTVLFALAMLIIAVLVGARGLAEQVNIGLRDANTGLGLTAGFSMAFIAIIADRILRGWAASLGETNDISMDG